MTSSNSQRSTFSDRFDVIERLGAGAMGTAWRARHLASGQPVVVKTLQLVLGPSQRWRLVSEARTLASMEHPNIVKVFDFGRVFEHPVLGPESDYFVMELADGGEFSAESVTGWLELKTVALQMLDALAHVHSHGRVHLDIKPSNILVNAADRSPRYILCDFGISQSLTGGPASTGVSGTPSYMAPEQGLGLTWEFGPWTDLYALGCMCWEAVSGRVPFDHAKLVSVIEAHLHSPLPRLKPRFEIPDGLEAWLKCMLAKRPKDRFASAAQAAWHLAQLGDPKLDTAEAAESSATGYESTHRVGTTVLEALIERDRVRSSDRSNGDVASQWERVPFPESWQRPESPAGHLLDAGLGLHNFRPPPFEGRESALDELWSTFGEVLDGRVEEVAITGCDGVGKSRLVDEFCRRLVELGQASVIRLDFERNYWRDAVAEAVASFLGLDHSGFESDLDIVESQLKLLTHGADPEAVKRLMIPGEVEDYYAVLAGLVDFFGAVSRRTPLVVVSDGLEHETQIFDAIEVARTRLGESALLFVSILEESSAPVVRARPDHAIELRPHTRTEVRRSLRKNLPLAPRVLDTILEAAGPDISFANQIVSWWIETGCVEASESGYVGGDVPSSACELWRERIDAVMAGIAPDQLDGAARLLEVAATLGRTFRKDALDRCLEALEVERCDRVLEMCAQRGYLEVDEDSITFADPRLVATLCSTLSHESKQQLCHVAAGVLSRSRALSDQMRAAEVWLDAGDVAKAVDQMYHVGLRCGAAEAVALSQWQDTICEAGLSDAPADQAVHAKVKVTLALDLIQNGNLEEALTCLSQLDALLEGLEDPAFNAERDLVVAHYHLFANTPEVGIPYAETVRDAVADDPGASMRALHTLGDLNMHARRFAQAEACFRRGYEIAETEDESDAAWFAYNLGMLALHTGDYEAAWAFETEAMDQFVKDQDRFGTMFCREVLGQIEHARGRFEPARNHLEAALAEARYTGYRGRTSMHERLARLHAQLGDPEAAVEHARAIEARAERDGFDLLVCYYFDAMIEAHARRMRWDDVEALLARAVETPARAGLYSEVISASLMRSAAHAEDAGRADLSRRLGDHARWVAANPLVSPANVVAP